MPLWPYASQIHIELYPGMECTLMTTGLGESTSGQPSKTISNNMGELDQQKLMLSMRHLFWSEYHSLLIFLFSIELVVSQLGEGFITLIKWWILASLMRPNSRTLSKWAYDFFDKWKFYILIVLPYRFRFLSLIMWSTPKNILMATRSCSACVHTSTWTCILVLMFTQWKP